MPMAKISVSAHSAIKAEIEQRKDQGETPKPTIESVIDEMVRDRGKKRKPIAIVSHFHQSREV